MIKTVNPTYANTVSHSCHLLNVPFINFSLFVNDVVFSHIYTCDIGSFSCTSGEGSVEPNDKALLAAAM